MVTKRLTKKIHLMGVPEHIYVNKNKYGWNLYDEQMKRGQIATTYKCVDDLIESVKRKEFPKSTYIGSVHEYNVK